MRDEDTQWAQEARPEGSLSGLKEHESDAQWDRFKDFVEKISKVPKEEVNELRAEREQKEKEKRAG